MGEKTDKELYHEFLQENMTSFEEIIIRHKDKLIYFIMRYVKNIDIAEDLAQDVFVYILIHRQSYDFNYSLKTYLFTIAKSKSLNYLKRENKISSLDENSIIDLQDLEEKVFLNERKNNLKIAMQKLKPEYQNAIYLADIEELSYKEISQIMKKPESSIKVLIHRARKNLKEILKKENFMLLKGDKIGIVACSNAQLLSNKEKINELEKVLKDIGLNPIFSKFIYEKYSVFSGSGKERGEALMNFYLDKDIKAIFDISGRDLANEVLDYLDFEIIKNNPKAFFGYSDLTTIINAIYSKTGNVSYLYQIRNLIYSFKDIQKERFINSILLGKDDLFNIKYEFLQGNKMSGVVVGGNIRCFLKLSGTPYMPNLENKILLLESYGGEVALMTTYLTQLKQMGAFKKIKGIILGTFTKMEENKVKPNIEEIVLKIVNDKNLPIIKTNEIGHGMDSKCMIIGKNIKV